MDNNIRDKLGSLAVYESKIPFKFENSTKSIAKYFKDDNKIGFITKDNNEKGIEVIGGKCPEGFHQTNTSYELVYEDVHPCFLKYSALHFNIICSSSLGTMSVLYLHHHLNGGLGIGFNVFDAIIATLSAGVGVISVSIVKEFTCYQSEHPDWVQTQYFEELKYCEKNDALVSAAEHSEL
jgi:hypothetical protein